MTIKGSNCFTFILQMRMLKPKVILCKKKKMGQSVKETDLGRGHQEEGNGPLRDF